MKWSSGIEIGNWRVEGEDGGYDRNNKNEYKCDYEGVYGGEDEDEGEYQGKKIDTLF